MKITIKISDVKRSITIETLLTRVGAANTQQNRSQPALEEKEPKYPSWWAGYVSAHHLDGPLRAAGCAPLTAGISFP